MREAAGRDVLYLRFSKFAGTGAQSPQAWGRGHEVKGKLGVRVRLGGGIEGRELPLGRIHWWGWAGSRQRET